MIRDRLVDGAQLRDEGFRHRGTEVSRIEALSDAVFGFGITLLVMSVEAPASYDQLIDSFRGIPAFAACFALVAWLWHVHFIFCRRYGLSDPRFYILNTIFLFVVVFYMYPLKFVFVGFVAWTTGLMQQRYLAMQRLTTDQATSLFVIYGLGFTLVSGVLAAMYAHALSLRRQLDLDAREVAITRHEIILNLLRAGVGVACAVAALALPPRAAPLAGFAFMLLGPIEAISGIRMGRLRRRVIPAESPRE